MVDEFTEVTSQGWGSRIGGSFKGILVGVLLFLAAFVLIWWNEGRAVQTAKSLKEGAGALVAAEAAKVNPANDGKLVHLTGLATTTEKLSDPQFMVTVEGLALKRVVKMYQWVEERKSHTEKKVGGGTETKTTYSYHQEWSESLIDSSSFRRPSGHSNPTSMPFEGRTLVAKQVTLGAYRLSPRLVGMIDAFQPMTLNQDTYQIPAEMMQRTNFYQGGLYMGISSSTPRVGDVQVFFQVVKPSTVSLIAKQQGNGFVPYQTEAGDELLMLQVGSHTGASMFKAAEASNKLLTWILRVVGWLVMFIGLSMILKPLSVIADVLPFLGNMVGFGASLVAGVIALVLTLITIGLAWIFYRPLLGIILLAVGVGLGVLFKIMRGKQAPAAAPPAPASAAPQTPPPPPAQSGGPVPPPPPPQ